MAGKIFLIPVTLGGDQYTQLIPEYVLNITRSLRLFTVEEIRSARRFLRLIDKEFPIDNSHFHILNEHTRDDEVNDILQPVLNGEDMGLMSEAGLPGIADPGSRLIAAAHDQNIRIIPLSGPSSIVLALISSGLNGQHFRFHGYLPARQDERNRWIKDIEKMAMKGETQIFMDTPYRSARVLESILHECKPETRLCIAADISLPSEEIRTMRISGWKKRIPDLKDRLVVFLLGSH